MASRPDLVGGTGRDVTRWMAEVPGLVAKEGAAGVMVVARADGSAAAFKVADGSDAARQAATVEALRRLGVDVDRALAAVAADLAVPVLGHGRPVGELRSLPWVRVG
jgi:L-asparaginase II